VTVVKLAPDGSEATRYPGEVVAIDETERWTVIRAVWTYRRVDLDGLSFVPGDELLEWFSPHHPFNAFAVFSPDGRLRGWYANVTHPAWLDDRASPPLLVWHDLYLDLVALPDGTITLRDEDELLAAGLRERDAPLYRRIVDASEELRHRFECRLQPFVVDPATGPELA
jgi:Protein of unknown function (DUF402)